MPVYERLATALERLPQVRLAVLFGSTARGTERAGSDLDLGVTLADGTEITSEERVALERSAGRTIDLVRLESSPPLLRFEIARSGRLLLDRDASAWSDFRAHAMIDWWDWAPTARRMHDTMAARMKEEARRGSP